MAPPSPPAPTLSASQSESVATLRAVANLPDDAAAAAMLSAAGWDLQAAVNSFLGDAPPLEPAASTPGAASPLPQQQQQQPSQQLRQQHAPPPPPPPPPPPLPSRARRALPGWLATLLGPLRAALAAISRVLDALLGYVGGASRAIEAAPGDTDTRRFLSFYDDRYGVGGAPAQRPPFFDGRYLEALAQAQRDLKFLVVYLHSDAHPATPAFARRVIASPAFTRAVNDGFVSWAGSVTQADAAAVQHALRVDAFPFVGVVAPPRATVRPAAALPPLGPANYGLLLSRISGAVLRGDAGDAGNADDAVGEAVATWLASVARDHDQRLAVVRRERADRDSARALRQEQDAEYAATLAADRARERAKADAAAAAEAAEAHAAAAEAARREKQDAVEARRARKRAALGPEPEKAPGVCTVLLRLPAGVRASRRFRGEDPVEAVFDWAEGECGVDIEVACLVATHPRKVFRYPEDASGSIKDAGFFPSAALMLEERAD